MTKFITGNVFSHWLHGWHNSRFFTWIISLKCHNSIKTTIAMVIPILEAGEPRLSDVKYCGQGHRVCKQWVDLESQMRKFNFLPPHYTPSLKLEM